MDVFRYAVMYICSLHSYHDRSTTQTKAWSPIFKQTECWQAISEKKKLSLWCSLSPQTLFHTPKWSENHNLRTNNIFDQQSASAPVKPCLLECNVPLDIHAWHLVQQHLSDFWAAATGLVKENALLRGNISDRKEWLWAESKGDHPTLYGRDTVFNSH